MNVGTPRWYSVLIRRRTGVLILSLPLFVSLFISQEEALHQGTNSMYFCCLSIVWWQPELIKTMLHLLKCLSQSIWVAITKYLRLGSL
jgi:hypothetical protein